MEAISIGMELNKDLLHPKHPMKLSDKENGPMDAASDETLREKLRGRPRSFPSFDYSDILFSPQLMHMSSFLVLPTSFQESQDEISFKGGEL
jgi:hypothetical protein